MPESYYVINWSAGVSKETFASPMEAVEFANEQRKAKGHQGFWIEKVTDGQFERWVNGKWETDKKRA